MVIESTKLEGIVMMDKDLDRFIDIIVNTAKSIQPGNLVLV